MTLAVAITVAAASSQFSTARPRSIQNEPPEHAQVAVKGCTTTVLHAHIVHTRSVLCSR